MIQKYNTHTVFKNEDADKYLNDEEREILVILLHKIETSRGIDGKMPNTYAVCNTDEPYYEKVIQEIYDGERLKEKST